MKFIHKSPIDNKSALVQVMTWSRTLQTCMLANSLSVLQMGVIDLDRQGHFGHFDSEF